MPRASVRGTAGIRTRGLSTHGTDLAVFWTVRLGVATFVFDVRPYLTSPFWRLGYQATNLVFIFLPIIYAWAAWRGAAP